MQVLDLSQANQQAKGILDIGFEARLECRSYVVNFSEVTARFLMVHVMRAFYHAFVDDNSFLFVRHPHRQQSTSFSVPVC